MIWLPEHDDVPRQPAPRLQPAECYNAHPGNKYNGAGTMLPFSPDGTCPVCGWSEPA